jgi:hypothetical protein
VLEELNPDNAQPTSTSNDTSECFPPDENPNGLRRGERVRRPTWKVVQAQLDAIPVTVDTPEQPTETPQPPRVHLLLRPTHVQERNAFGLSRSYKGIPSSIPDQPNAQSYIPEYSHPKPRNKTRTIEEIIHPYPNLSSFLFDHYFWVTGTSKSRNDRDALQALITHPDFRPADVEGVNFRRLEEELRGRSSHGDWEQQRGWRTSNITIGVPTGVKKTASVRKDNAAREARMRSAPCPPPSSKADIDGAPLPIGTFHYRPICEVIRETFSRDPAARSFHYHPYKQTHHPPTNPTLPTERVYDELYSSDAWIQEDAKIQTIKIDQSAPEHDLPRAIAAIMLWSDETLLNTFSQNKAWPIYMFFGNQPKRERSAITAGGGRHLAYLPEVSTSSPGSKLLMLIPPSCPITSRTKSKLQ